MSKKGRFHAAASDIEALENDQVADEISAEPYEDGYEDVITGRVGALGDGPSHGGPIPLNSYSESQLAAAIKRAPGNAEGVEEETAIDDVEGATLAKGTRKSKSGV